MLLIGVDRFLASYLLTKYKQYVTLRNVKYTLVCVWVYICCLCLIPFAPDNSGSTGKFNSSIVSAGNYSNMSSGALKMAGAFFNASTDNIRSKSLPDDGKVNRSRDSFLLMPAVALDKNRQHNNENRQFIGNHNRQPDNKRNVSACSDLENLFRGRGHFYRPQEEWTTFMLAFNAALPYISICICYLNIIHCFRAIDARDNARQSSIAHRTTNTENFPDDGASRQRLLKDEKRKRKKSRDTVEVVRFSFAISTIYFVLWTPSIIYYTTHSLCADKCFPQGWDGSVGEKQLVFVLKGLSYLNGLFSPLVYGYRYRHFYRKLTKWIVTMVSTVESKSVEDGL